MTRPISGRGSGPTSIIDHLTPEALRRARALMAKYLLPPDERGCVLWSGDAYRNGYGRVGVGSRQNGTRRFVKASRLAWELFHERPIPDGRYILHLCDTPACCAIEHLRDGTHRDNMDDMSQRGRRAMGEDQPHAKLSVDRVLAARTLHGLGWSTHKLARVFGVSQPSIRRALAGDTWSHVPRAETGVHAPQPQAPQTKTSCEHLWAGFVPTRCSRCGINQNDLVGQRAEARP